MAYEFVSFVLNRFLSSQAAAAKDGHRAAPAGRARRHARQCAQRYRALTRMYLAIGMNRLCAHGKQWQVAIGRSTSVRPCPRWPLCLVSFYLGPHSAAWWGQLMMPRDQ